MAKLPSLVTGCYRLQRGQEILDSKAGLSFHENFLYLFHGTLPSQKEVEVFDTTQSLQLEHGFNASTFAARVAYKA